jgi:selenophosphate synthase
MSVVPQKTLILNNAKSGDLLLLTKPLGTRQATNLKESLVKDNQLWKDCQTIQIKS